MRFFIVVVVVSAFVHAAPKLDEKPIDRVEGALQESNICDQDANKDYIFCVQHYNQNLRKRHSVTVNDVTACNLLYVNCIRRCSNNDDCLTSDCPVCPVLDDYNEMLPEDIEEHVENEKSISNNLNDTNDTDNYLKKRSAHADVGNAQDYGFGRSADGACCLVIQPKKCYMTEKGFRCHHKRHKTCGKHCTSRIIHAQSKHHCVGNNCQHQINFISQPPAPVCQYISIWPYVVCSLSYEHNCEGCYDHSGYDNEDSTRCEHCFGNNFHTNNRHQTGPGSSPLFYPAVAFVYPYWYPPMFLPPYFARQYNSGFNQFPNSDPSLSEYDSESLNYDLHEWQMEASKCKTIGPDGKVTLKDCAGIPDMENFSNNKNFYEIPSNSRPHHV